MYDGPVTEVGWVADQVAQGTQVGLMLCPSNPSLVSETYYDLLATPNTSLNVCNVTYDGNPPVTQSNGVPAPFAAPCYQIYRNPTVYPANSSARQTMVLYGIYGAGFNTNYTASWFLVRGGPRLDASGNGVEPANMNMCLPAAPAGVTLTTALFLDRNSTIGPLVSAQFDSGNVPSNTVPLLGCGAAVAGKTLPMPLGSAAAGTGLTASFTGGPMQNNGWTTQLTPPNFAPGTASGGAAGWSSQWSGGWTQNASAGSPPAAPNAGGLIPPMILQDYRQFGPVHRGGYCNIVFVDGSVRCFHDFNSDGQLNDGFAGTYPLQSNTNGFTDGAVEIGPSDVSSSGTLYGP